ncbi:MAG: hypothetical protein HY010_07650 [Acidobacteria bacterium]|nr:hypothetical protein [Acidobacteriota bacterium]
MNPLTQYYRCPERFSRIIAHHDPSDTIKGYFRFGEEICFGKCRGGYPSRSSSAVLHDALAQVKVDRGVLDLPFDLTEVIDGLRQERYMGLAGSNGSDLASPVNRLYYLLRPFLPVAVRKHLQRMRLSDWKKLAFPTWPVDRTVDAILEKLLLLSLRAEALDRIPFIWFWPEGAPSCAIITHDVETTIGRDFCETLMDIDDTYGVKAAFQIVPEQRYEVTSSYLESITRRDFEVGVQDLNHDGRLYMNKEQFRTRAAMINEYGRRWGARGFRAAILYRRQEWFDALDFDYEMSVPNVAHLDPQRGGCCTVMPYFVGKILEIPVTATQDYSLFHILKQHSIQLWEQQIELIMKKNGLISFIIHPDYIISRPEQETYEALLSHLSYLRQEKGLWITTPREVNRWWRQRAQMSLVETGNGWRIEGAGNERALIAYASEQDGHLKFTLEAGREVR